MRLLRIAVATLGLLATTAVTAQTTSLNGAALSAAWAVPFLGILLSIA
jgi:hypothetical protein